MASRVAVRTLNSVDLPTFGRPTRAMTGSMAGAEVDCLFLRRRLVFFRRCLLLLRRCLLLLRRCLLLLRRCLVYRARLTGQSGRTKRADVSDVVDHPHHVPCDDGRVADTRLAGGWARREGTEEGR